MASTTNIAADYGFGARAPWAAARASEHNMKERVRLSGLFPQVNNEPLTTTLTLLVEEFKKNAALGAILERRRALEGQAQYVMQGGFGRPPPGGRNAPPSPGDPMDESSTTEHMEESSTTAYMDESSTTEDMDESSTTEDRGNPPPPSSDERDRKRGVRNRARPRVQRASRSQGRGAREYAG